MADLSSSPEPADLLQGHLARWHSEIDVRQQQRLAEQIKQLDLELLKKLWTGDGLVTVPADMLTRMGPPEVIPADIAERNAGEFQQALREGERALRNGTVAAVLVAGGQGTRLDFPHPKGMFPIGPVSGKSLFQWMAEQLLARSRQADAVIPWYIMTSDATHAATRACFEQHAWFGLRPDDVCFFPQGNLPALDRATGQVLWAKKDQLALSPDGHGGALEALRKANLFADMRARGIEYLFYHQVDNPLLRMCDPAFLGFHILRGAEASTKVVRKLDPQEKVGLVVDVEGSARVIEYSDLSLELAERRTSSGELWLSAGNTAIHVFNRDFLERVAGTGIGPHGTVAPESAGATLGYHRALKRVPYIDEVGNLVQPTVENAYKFERFIFDVLPLARRSLAVEIHRDQEFVPLKNRSGENSPEHVRQSLRRLFTAWLRRAGLTTADELEVEIGPLMALDERQFLDRMSAGNFAQPEVRG